MGIAGSGIDIPLDPAQLVLEIEPLLIGHARRQFNNTVFNGVVQVSSELASKFDHNRPNGKKAALFVGSPNILRG